MVLFLTGECSRDCWYCPLSRERKGKDIVFANDTQVKELDEIVKVAEMMGALGTGITGGEALLKVDRLKIAAGLLKTNFGKSYYIHLYTGIIPLESALNQLIGLIDEIRLHPPADLWADIMDTTYPSLICEIRKKGFSIGIEVPSIPSIRKLLPLLPLVDFFNINELEWGDQNADEMRSRGFSFVNRTHNAIEGSLEWSKEFLSDSKVNFCSSSFKDSVQLRNRLIRVAERTRRLFDTVTDDGTILYGVLENPCEEDRGILSDIDPELYEICGDEIHIGYWYLYDAEKKFLCKRYIVERYPNEGIIVEVTPVLCSGQ